MSVERAALRAAKAVHERVSKTIDQSAGGAGLAVVRRTRPLQAELADEATVLTQGEDMELSAQVKLYDASHGIKVGDMLVVHELRGFRWLATGVLTDDDLTEEIDGAVLKAGSVTIPKLSFDPATQAELDAEATLRSTHSALTTTAHGGIVADSDTRLPTQGENDALIGTSGTPSSLNKYVTGADARLPTTNENDALLGTSGAPSNTNRYVTDADTLRRTTIESVTPPASPQVGDLWLYHPQAAVSWMFRYEPDQDATYPWQYVGGSVAMVEVGMGTAEFASAFSVWQDLSTSGPSYTVARKGVYHLRTEHWFQNAFGDWASGHMGILVNATPPPAADHTKVNCHLNAGGHASASWDRWATLAANDVLLCRYNSANVNSNPSMSVAHLSYWSRRLYVTPLRVG